MPDQNSPLDEKGEGCNTALREGENKERVGFCVFVEVVVSLSDGLELDTICAVDELEGTVEVEETDVEEELEADNEGEELCGWNNTSQRGGVE